MSLSGVIGEIHDDDEDSDDDLHEVDVVDEVDDFDDVEEVELEVEETDPEISVEPVRVEPPPARRDPPRTPVVRAPPPAPAKPPAPARSTPPRPIVPPDTELATRETGTMEGEWCAELFIEHYMTVEPRDMDIAANLDAAFITRAVKPNPGASVLDVGCGAGWHAVALAKRGLEVTGLDNSKVMIARATKKNDREKTDAKFMLGDMRSLPKARAYDIATCLGTTFGFFDDEQNRQCLIELREVLRPGGKLVLHVTNRDFQVRILPSRSWWQGKSSLVLDVVEFRATTNLMQVDRTIVFEDGRQFQHKYPVRLYSVHELSLLVRSVGLRVLEKSGSRFTPGRLYGATSPDIWIVAERPA